ncbi:peptidoglycan/xylan/chitin deacetylase (PgdA/CDA1 family)/flagellar basal body-associated protein FliL [Anaerotaenia torta]|uniref:polysaccharide deacetylase family protein n=1 Tax=Anaerotaenia torta TaxID=433293 RepID=UPI003D253C44
MNEKRLNMVGQDQRKSRRNPRRLIIFIVVELVILLALFGGYRLYVTSRNKEGNDNPPKAGEEANKGDKGQNNSSGENVTSPAEKEPTAEELAAQEEQERLQKELAERDELVKKADLLALGYNYDEAVQLIKDYKGSEGDYNSYPALSDAITRLETEQASLVNLGGSYSSVTLINHIFFHCLVADNARAFDGDYESKGYNMYMATIYEFNKLMDKMYKDGYVLVSMADLTRLEKQEDGTMGYVENEIMLRPGKKPFVLSVDDVSYYEYMDGDGFASRMIIGEDGKVTCEMIQADGSVVTGAFDVVPLLDAFVEEHPDFSYKGAKGLLALTGYEGIFGYRTNDETSPTYEQDKEAATKVADALKATGWELGSHSWGHRNMGEMSLEHLKTDTNRWLKEVAPLIGGTDILVFPKGIDIETTMGHYSSDKFKFLKECGFNLFLNVDGKPWMHIKKDYVRMGRRPIDGQAMLQFPQRLADLFSVEEIIDPERPPMNW